MLISTRNKSHLFRILLVPEMQVTVPLAARVLRKVSLQQWLRVITIRLICREHPRCSRLVLIRLPRKVMIIHPTGLGSKQLSRYSHNTRNHLRLVPQPNSMNWMTLSLSSMMIPSTKGLKNRRHLARFLVICRLSSRADNRRGKLLAPRFR